MNCTSSNQIVRKGRVSLFVFFFVVVSFCFVFFRRMVANKWRRNKEITIFTMLNALKDLTGWSHHTKRHNWTLCLLSVGHHTTYDVFLPKKKKKLNVNLIQPPDLTSLSRKYREWGTWLNPHGIQLANSSGQITHFLNK